MIVILLCRENAAVVHTHSMQSLVMSAIVSNDRPAKLMRACEDVFVLASLHAVFLAGDNVVTELSQEFDDGEWEVLIGVKEHAALLHESLVAFFILLDGPVNLSGVLGSVVPCRLEILGSQ